MFCGRKDRARDFDSDGKGLLALKIFCLAKKKKIPIYGY